MSNSKAKTIAEQVGTILDMVGLDVKAMQVIDFDGDVSVIYPNYMQNEQWDDTGMTDLQVLDRIEKIMVEHMLDVQHDLKMIKRYKEMVK